MLDSLQDKWGVGVHLLAPATWESFHLGIFQMESAFTQILTVAGLIPFLFIKKVRHDAQLLCLDSYRIVGCFICAIAYFSVPLLFINDVVASDSRYLHTLENKDERHGKLLELDRQIATMTGDTWHTTTHTGEVLTILNPDARMSGGEIYSFRATFANEHEIRVTDWQRHSASRDVASHVGLFLIGCWLTAILITRMRTQSTVVVEVS